MFPARYLSEALGKVADLLTAAGRSVPFQSLKPLQIFGSGLLCLWNCYCYCLPIWFAASNDMAMWRNWRPFGCAIQEEGEGHFATNTITVKCCFYSDGWSFRAIHRVWRDMEGFVHRFIEKTLWI